MWFNVLVKIKYKKDATNMHCDVYSYTSYRLSLLDYHIKCILTIIHYGIKYNSKELKSINSI